MAKYYDIHVFYSRSNGFSVPFKTNAEGEQEVIDAALKAGRIDAEDAESVDSVDEIYQEEYLLMGGNEEEDNESIEQEEIELSKTMDKSRDENWN